MRSMYLQNNTRNATAAWMSGSIPALSEHQHCLTLHRLMDASERQLENVARQGDFEEMQVAQRVLECPVAFLHWQHEYAQIMRGVAATTSMQQQKRSLLSATLALLHRKSLFEYLRDHQVHDRQREMLLMHFHGGNDYPRAMVIEHGNYLRSAASYVCANFLGLRLLHDLAFARPLDDYARLYASYFAAYSNLLLSQTGSNNKLGVAVYRLKCELGQRRRQLLNPAQSLH